MVFKDPTDILTTSLLVFVGVYLFSYFSKTEGFADTDEVQKIIALIQQTVGKVRLAIKEKGADNKKYERKLDKISSDASSIQTWWMKQDPVQKSANMQILYSPQLQNVILDVNDIITDLKLNIQTIPISKDTESKTFTR